jgi:phytoene dehydrogenase-like protein
MRGPEPGKRHVVRRSNQIFSARLMLGYTAYRMPLIGLYLCGSGAYPGGGVTGVPSHNAAQAVIADFSQK